MDKSRDKITVDTLSMWLLRVNKQTPTLWALKCNSQLNSKPRNTQKIVDSSTTKGLNNRDFICMATEQDNTEPTTRMLANILIGKMACASSKPQT